MTKLLEVNNKLREALVTMIENRKQLLNSVTDEILLYYPDGNWEKLTDSEKLCKLPEVFTAMSEVLTQYKKAGQIARKYIEACKNTEWNLGKEFIGIKMIADDGEVMRSIPLPNHLEALVRDKMSADVIAKQCPSCQEIHENMSGYCFRCYRDGVSSISENVIMRVPIKRIDIVVKWHWDNGNCITKPIAQIMAESKKNRALSTKIPGAITEWDLTIR